MKNVLSALVNVSKLLRNYLQTFSDRFILHHSSCSGLATRSALDDVCHVLCHAFANSFRTYLVVQSNTDVLCFRRFIFTSLLVLPMRHHRSPATTIAKANALSADPYRARVFHFLYVHDVQNE
jgi:hypothetical protein